MLLKLSALENGAERLFANQPPDKIARLTSHKGRVAMWDGGTVGKVQISGMQSPINITTVTVVVTIVVVFGRRKLCKTVWKRFALSRAAAPTS